MHSPYIRINENAHTAALLIHGIAGSPAHFRDLIPLIPEGWSVYNVLLDGHGGTVADFSHASMEQWNAQVTRQLDAILQTHRRVLIIAHSMGTLLAIRQAIRRPEAVAGLFLLNVPLVPFVRPGTAVDSLRLALGKPGSSPSAQAMAADCSIQLTPGLWQYLGWAPRFYELLREAQAVRKLLPQLRTPTQTFHSRHDELVHSRSCRYLEGHPSITHTLLEASGHYAYSRLDAAILQAQLKKTISRLH